MKINEINIRQTQRIGDKTRITADVSFEGGEDGIQIRLLLPHDPKATLEERDAQFQALAQAYLRTT